MFKNMKLGSKIIGGFSIVLILLAIVAYVGFNGLSGVVDRVVNTEDMNRIIKFTLETRQQEKNFIIRKDKEYVKRVNDLVPEIKDQANATKSTFNDPANKQQMDQIISAIGKYETAYKRYVDLFDQKNSTEASMVDNARALRTQSENILEQIQKDLEQLNIESERKQANNFWLADAANRCIKIALQAQISQNMYIRTHEKKFADEIKSYKKDFLAIVNEGINRLETAEDKKTVADMGKQADVYVDRCEEYVKLAENQAGNTRLASKEKEVVTEAANLIAMGK